MDPIVVAGIAAVVMPSITSHEAMHGLAADRLDDPTARERGRLTLNALPHIDWFFTILIPAFLLWSGSSVIFGGAKPVPVNVGPGQFRAHDARTGAAGLASHERGRARGPEAAREPASASKAIAAGARLRDARSQEKALTRLFSE